MLKWLKRRVLNNEYFLRPLRDSSKFEFFQSKGIHVTANHFYCPVPDTSALPAGFFQRRYDWEGIDTRLAEQQALLETFVRQYKAEYSRFPFERTSVRHEYFWDNGTFQCLDAISLYGMIRHVKPRRVIEVGGGNSTMIAAHAVVKNAAEQHATELITIEPYPWEIHRSGMPGLAQLIEQKAQDVPLDLFKTLQSRDILFIDSSHILKSASDVAHYFMSVLPHLKPGVIVHFHDIFLPEEYPEEWVMTRHFFFTEQYILRAFLTHNAAFRILFAGRFLQLSRPDLVRDALDFYRSEITKAGSFWIERGA